jgi:type II secretory pathway component HofQ
MPWDQALAVAMKNNGLECEPWGNVLHIATLETLKSQADRLNGKDAMPKTGCLPAEVHGPPMNLDLRELDLNDWFRLIHEISQLNLAVEPDVKGTITINVTNLPWERALDFSARNNGFRCEFKGDTLHIVSAR